MTEPTVKQPESIKQPEPVKQTNLQAVADAQTAADFGRLAFQRIGDDTSRVTIGEQHVGTITKREGTPVFLPVPYEFITLAQLKEIIGKMEKL